MISTPLPCPQTPSLEDTRHCLIAQHYRARSNRTTQQRETSPILQLKKLHNWIKTVLIQLHTRNGDSVLDLACGKGGDLLKWEKSEIAYYVGADIVEGSLDAARTRYNEMGGTGRSSKRPFRARLICVNCFGPSLREALKGEAAFDVCSCQFALHYAWSSEERARVALRNVAALLKPGGFFIGTIPDAEVITRKLKEAKGSMEFGNRLYKVKFDKADYGKRMTQAFGIQYEFHLEDAVDHCPEWLVPFGEMKRLAAEYGLELVSRKNFHTFVHDHAQDISELMQKLGGSGSISPDEWDCVSIYMTFVFQKRATTY